MTEQEARQKWCPFAGSRAAESRTEDGFFYSAIKSQKGGVNLMCIASDCMAWRWKVTPSENVPVEPGIGYCGLAGRP